MARRRTGFQKKIETVHWTLGQDGFGALAAGNLAIMLNAAQHLPETLLRIRGEWGCVLDGVQTGDEAVAVASGLILVPEGTGATVLWSPIIDGDAPWIWWDTLHLLYQEQVNNVIGTSHLAGRARVIDSKAMRRVRNQELQWVIENATITGAGNAASVNGTISVRTLSGS